MLQIFLSSELLKDVNNGKFHVCMLSHVWLFVTPWTVTCQVLLPMGFSEQEYWIELLFPPPGGLHDPRIEPVSPESLHWHTNSLPLSHLRSPGCKYQQTRAITRTLFLSIVYGEQQYIQLRFSFCTCQLFLNIYFQNCYYIYRFLPFLWTR